MRRGLSLLAAAATGAVLGQLLLRARERLPRTHRAPVTDPRIPPSESSATRLREKPGYAQEDADQEPPE